MERLYFQRTADVLFLFKKVYIGIFAKLSLPASKGWVALSSLVRRRRRPSRIVTSPLYGVLDHTNHTFSESSWSKDIKTDITKCLLHKYTNTNTQIHKYSIWRSARKTQKVVYFWKEDCSRIPKIIFPCAKRKNTKIQIQNTQIHKYSIWRSAGKTQHVVYFWKEDCSRISKIIFPCVKEANTKIQTQNTVIHKYRLWQSATRDSNLSLHARDGN